MKRKKKKWRTLINIFSSRNTVHENTWRTSIMIQLFGLRERREGGTQEKGKKNKGKEERETLKDGKKER